MNPREVAALTGVSVRTLHHYDTIGLLCPRRNPENGYREYAAEDLDLLQQILFFKACGFSLARIRALLRSPSFDRERAYALQRQALLHERRRIDTMLDTLTKTMQASKGEITMTPKEKFLGLDLAENPYEAEARRLWGDAAVDESSRRLAALTPDGRKDVAQAMHALFTRLAEIRHLAPDSDAVQAEMDNLFRYFNQTFSTYTPQAFAGLGQMYVGDERFTRNIDQYGEGLSQFLAEAMAVYAAANRG